ncbi:class I adenylate-forming enzyme family protein [Streptomyces sp. A1499]|uniref:class I adenylate-forming enzyme family protein n=1 Tax=Streptomyces sp. A1499 TaxID=2563104 RepID=UPI00144AC55C|nr:class I adenylate-forming enzyme family protein [Streptomyces sp. A1499]
MIEATVHGRTTLVWRNAPKTLADLLVSGNAWGERDFLVHGAERWTYARHGRAAASLARWLVGDGGVRPGDRVAIAASNRVSWSISFWGAACAGAVVVPLNAWGTGEELEYALNDSGATWLFADRARLARLAGRLAGIHLVTLDTGADAPDAAATGAAGARALEDLADPDAEFVLPAVAVDTDDDATILYTSGTTGRPKGAVGTHRNMTTNVMNLLYWGAFETAWAAKEQEAAPLDPVHPPASAHPARSQDPPSTLVTVPLFHATGCHATLVAGMAQGGKLVLMNKFDADLAVDLIERERLTRLVGVPTTIQAILDAGAVHDLTSVTYVGYGGAPAPTSLPARVCAQMPRAVCGVGYGLTESSANATTNMGARYAAHPDSVGTPCPVVEILAVDDHGTPLPPGQVGELVIRGPNVVRGYWKRPKDTAAAFTSGGLRTGDLGWIDADGRVYISDRSKDVIIRGGENVYCAEIEDVIGEHPQVAEAAVVGAAHPLLGEEVAVFVVPRQTTDGASDGTNSVDTDDLRRHVRERLAGFKVPTIVEISTERLPRTPTGKLRKDVLRRLLADRLAAPTGQPGTAPPAPRAEAGR